MLTEQDRSDLLGLAGGVGDEASDVRGRELVRRNQEAAEFLREVEQLGRMLEAEPVAGAAELDAATLERLSSGAYRRYRRRRVRAYLMPLALAATFVLAFVGIRSGYRSVRASESLPDAESLAIAAYAGRGYTVERSRIGDGKSFSTDRDHVSLLRLTGKRVLLVGPDTTVIPSETEVSLKKGKIIVQAPGSFHFYAGFVEGDLRGGRAMIDAGPQRARIAVLAGWVDLTLSDGSTRRLNEKEAAVWEPGTREFEVYQRDAVSLPDWAWKLLERIPWEDTPYF